MPKRPDSPASPFAFLTGERPGPPGTTMARRERAPRRAGHRTQLTVPHELWAAASALAAQVGTTPNDVVVRLAATGLEVAERHARAEAIAEERWTAYRRRPCQEPLERELPSEEEAVAAGVDIESEQ